MCKKRVCEPVSLIRVDFNPFNSLLGEGGGVAATPGLLWIVLKIEICFSTRRFYTSTNAEMTVQSWDWLGVVPWN